MLNRIKKLACKISNKLYLILLMFSAALALAAWGLGADLKKIEIVNLLKYYNTIVNIFPSLEENLSSYRIIFTLLFTMILALYLLKRFYKEKALLIKHCSMSQDIAEIDHSLAENYSMKTVEINQCNMNTAEALRIQDEIMANLYDDKYKLYFYYGIASTPFVFRLGYQFGDERNVRLLHKNREGRSLFRELIPNDNIKTPLKHVVIEGNRVNKELLVSVGTSFPITVDDKKCFDLDNMHQIYFYTEPTNFDIISSYEQMDWYRNSMMDMIRQTVKDNNIETIHIIAATSVAFTFYWAQSFSKNHDPDIIVYHYQDKTYPWGIKVKCDSEHCIVQNHALPIK